MELPKHEIRNKFKIQSTIRVLQQWDTLPAHSRGWLAGACLYFAECNDDEPDFNSPIDGLQTVTKTFFPPFTRVDREADSARAWKAFEEQYGEQQVSSGQFPVSSEEAAGSPQREADNSVREAQP